MDKLDRKFIKYCSLHVHDMGELRTEVSKLLSQQRPIKAIDSAELWRLLKQDHHDYLRETSQRPYNFSEFLSWNYPVSRMILESRY